MVPQRLELPHVDIATKTNISSPRCRLNQLRVIPAYAVNRDGEKVGHRTNGPANSVYTGTRFQSGHVCNFTVRQRIGRSSVDA